MGTVGRNRRRRLVKTRPCKKQLSLFNFSRILTNFAGVFTKLYEGTEDVFYFFYKTIIFRFIEEKVDIRSEYLWFYFFFHEIVQLGNRKSCISKSFTSFSFLIYSAMKHTLVDQSKRTYHPNYFIKCTNSCKISSML